MVLHLLLTPPQALHMVLHHSPLQALHMALHHSPLHHSQLQARHTALHLSQLQAHHTVPRHSAPDHQALTQHPAHLMAHHRVHLRHTASPTKSKHQPRLNRNNLIKLYI